MRIDASQVLGQAGVKIKVGTGGATDSLKDGDVIRAKVVSNDKSGVATLKLENGQSFSAKLGADVKLSPGDVLLLEVTGKEKGQVTLSFAGVESADDDLSLGQKTLVADFTDKSLAPYASKLSEHNMPVNEETARMMRQLIAQNPGLSLDEAAFLASNKLTGDESLMKAALATLATGEKTDAMIARLLALAGEQTSQPESNQGVRGGDSPSTLTVNTANAAPLTDLITTLVKSLSGTFATPLQGESAPSTVTQTIITQPNVNMQTNAENAGEFTEILQKPASQGDGSAVSQPQGQATQGDGSAVSQPQVTQGGSSPALQGATPEAQVNTPVASDLPGAEATAQQTSQNTTAATETTQSMSSVVAQLLSDIPEFSGTPQSALHRFSEMLLRVAGESTEAASDKETLVAQLDKLFTKISKDDTDAGARLRDARQELYTRLSLIEEAISRAAQPARAEMLVQTQKLMDHVRLLNSIEQFVYMQLPVQLSEERKTADLYVFKRKGGKRADPDNVNILMAIDLEFMGHWEALINIKNKDVSIQMEVPGEAEKEHFNANTVMLHNMLSEAGFKLVSTNIKFAEIETTPLTALSAFDRYTGGKQGIIDFKI